MTGGAGFVGANLVRLLISGGREVRVLDDFRTGRSEYLADLDVEVIRGEIGDTALVTELAREVDDIVHLAAAGSVVDSVADPVANFEAWYGPPKGKAMRPPIEERKMMRPSARRTSGSIACVTAT